MKKLLSLCLERDIVPYDSYLGRQGELLEKIYFIVRLDIHMELYSKKPWKRLSFSKFNELFYS